MDNGSQNLSEPSFVSLLGGIANDAKELLHIIRNSCALVVDPCSYRN